MKTLWVLLWIFNVPFLDKNHTRTQAINVKDYMAYDSQAECERALVRELDVNDTRYMILHKDARLVCVSIKP